MEVVSISSILEDEAKVEEPSHAEETVPTVEKPSVLAQE
jgi:hypothetical protein